MAYIKEQNCCGNPPVGEPYAPYYSGEDYKENCRCLNCQKIAQGKTVDILIVPMKSKIDDLRKLVFSFCDTAPQELRRRYLIIKNADSYLKRTLDIFLKLLEEAPAYLDIFLTAHVPENLPNAVLSRCESINQPALSPQTLKRIVESNPMLSGLRGKVLSYPFQSISELRLYSKLDLEDQFRILFISQTSPWSLEKAGTELWKALDLEGDHILISEARSFVLNFCHSRWEDYLLKNVSTLKGLDEARLTSVHVHYAAHPLFEYAARQDGSQFLNLQEQFIAYIMSLYMARRSLGVL
jgi:hypothetical protein